MPVAGATLVQETDAAPPMLRYFGGASPRSAVTIDPNLTQTGPSAGAILPNDFALHTYTGMGGQYMGAPIQYWEANQGASTAHLVFVQRFHRCANASCS
jgi:hypothetical protein